jgi:methylenetetrahydrofolate dehydrogenase (NADP+)/methenyltetrahydrofolate cyclohydrolase
VSARLLTGKEPAEEILRSLVSKVASLKPLLVIVQVGDDPLSAKYIAKKIEKAESIGMKAEHLKLPASLSEAELIVEIERLNADEGVTGYIIQLPLPEELWEASSNIFSMIDPAKDVDGFTSQNMGNVFLSAESEHLPPATPAGVIALLDYYEIDVAGKNVVIIGRSNLVGKPLAAMLTNRSATVTLCHSKTDDLAVHTEQADIVISAVGKAGLVTGKMLHPGAIVIDIGMTHDDGAILGDIDFESASAVASAITPVPGGVGPLTVACLLRNVVRAARAL